MLRTLCAPCFIIAFLALTACDTAPKETPPPALNPEQAAALLHYNNKAEVWMIHVRKTDPTCEYKLDLPEQNSHPTEIGLHHIVVCGGRPSPMEFDASVSFAYDKDQKKWVISRFSS